MEIQTRSLLNHCNKFIDFRKDVFFFSFQNKLNKRTKEKPQNNNSVTNIWKNISESALRIQHTKCIQSPDHYRRLSNSGMKLKSSSGSYGLLGVYFTQLCKENTSCP